MSTSSDVTTSSDVIDITTSSDVIETASLSDVATLPTSTVLVEDYWFIITVKNMTSVLNDDSSLQSRIANAVTSGIELINNEALRKRQIQTTADHVATVSYG